MVERLTVRGEDVEPAARDEVDRDLADIGYRVVRQVSTTDASRSRGEAVELDVDDRHVLEVTDTNGVTAFLTAEAAGRAAQSRGGRLDLALPSVTRGMGTAIRAVVQSTIGGDVAELGREVAGFGLDELLDPTARELVRKLAERLDRPSHETSRGHARDRGLYAVSDDLLLLPDNLDPDIGAPDEPCLVLLHGTFSNTEASFGGLRQQGTADWDRLLEEYPGRLLALEHQTLSQTPVQNALDLARALPDGARLHLLSHSRGGLVGEVLSCALYGNPSTLAYSRRRQQDHPDVQAWDDLLTLLEHKHLSVERFVRVACPARGTLLASRKVDTWASYFFNALRLVPGLDAAGVLSVVKKVVLVLLEQHLDVRAVPGLECMVPESALVATLAGVERPVDDGLLPVMGDVQGKGILGKIALALPDLFFSGDHDLVVNTDAMDGGMPRKDRTDTVRLKPFRGPEHTHFGYFRTPASREAIRRALAPDVLASAAGGRGGEASATTIRPSRGDVVDGPTLVIVPDLMGSVLYAADEPGSVIWPAPGAVARRGVEKVITPDGPDGRPPDLAEPDGSALAAPYDDLVKILRQTFVVKAFPWDWRRPLGQSSARLRALLDALPAKDDDTGASRDCLVLGHGVGALLALDACAGTSRRPVLLDPAFEGRPGMNRRAEGDDGLTRALALVDVSTTAAEIGRRLAGLEAFRARSEGLVAAPLLRPDTPMFVCVHDNAHSGHGPLARPCQHYLSRAPDGSILTSPEVLQDLRRLALGHRPVGLVAGQPTVTPPATQPVEAPDPGVVLDPVEEPDREPAGAAPDAVHPPMLFPTADELARLALGIREDSARQPVSLLVRVTHGDLRVGDGPWIVGAQDGTPIGGAEKALDQRLDGALSTHRILGQYPGSTGTIQLFTGPHLEGAAAAVIGMGAPGELTPGQLTTSITQAVLRLAAANLHVGPVARQGRGQQSRGFEVSCVLVGTVGSGALPIDTSVNAIITGVRRANRRLRDLRRTPDEAPHDAWESPPVVGSLQLIELYEDRAVLALHAATNLARTDGTTDDDVLQTVTALQIGTGGRKGTMTAGYLDDRWRTIRVTASAPAALQLGSVAPASPDAERPGDLVDLTFTELGRNAGAETTVTSTQRRVIDQVIQKSIHTDMEAGDRAHNTLYELLVPLHMKGQGRPSDNIMFILDEHAASLPLEMLATRSYDDAIVPLAGEVGIVRRLETTTFRQSVRPASGDRALVIGDPRAVGWPPLAGARHEANRVARSLESHGYVVERQISASEEDDSVCTTSILDALYAHDYRIIHIAAHGDVRHDLARSDARGRPGVVIGPGDWLTALEIQQMQTTPDLVFLNCCHLGSELGASTPPGAAQQSSVRGGRPGWRPDRFAAGIARQLIDNGVRGVVAAGWAVSDSAAAVFATTFYEEFLTGHELGPASLAARKEVLRSDSRTSTWGAYQVYGPPALKLPGETAAPGLPELTNPKSVRDRLSNLARSSARLPSGERDRLDAVASIGESLRKVVSEAPPEWIDGEAQQTIGEIWRNLGCYAEAIDSFRSALETWSSVAALNVVDQLVSAHVRLGAKHARNGMRREARGCFRHAEQVLDTMDVLARSDADKRKDPEGARADVAKRPERLKLTANYKQHELWLHVRSDTALHEAWDAFAQAADAYDQARRPDRYCRLGELTLRWIRSQRPAKQVLTTEQDLETVAELLQSARRERWSPKPFAQLGAADCLLVEALLRTPVATSMSPRERNQFAAIAFDVTDAYRDAFRKGLSERERASVTDYLDLLQRLLPASNVARQQLLKVIADELT
ncbi:CHAT domain-containing protein [Nocardioides eburneiflavus]|uniref:CHAT domain-containing protein n=1 Tax=Nocardioides eburneiflavus TaxID=2518372 RepID=A0A4Z1CFY5_9ACTN|nr:CHAT domain-containing protein [Nocardioides eburneiflavus]